MLDINEIAEQITREEFLHNIKINGCLNLNNKIIAGCPGKFGLKEIERNICMTSNPEICIKCWEKAAENIKFKDDVEENTKMNIELIQNYCPSDLGLNDNSPVCRGMETPKSICTHCWNNALNENKGINAETKIIKGTIKEVTKDSKDRLYYGDEILAMIRKGEIKKGQKILIHGKDGTELPTKNSYITYRKNNFELCVDGIISNVSLAQLLLWRFKPVEKEYFNLKDVILVGSAMDKQVRYKNWNNFIPVSDLMANIVFLIKDNKLDAADLNRKVWEVQ